MPLILNEPQPLQDQDFLHQPHHSQLSSSVMAKPTNHNQLFTILPLNEQATLSPLAITQPPSPNRHPTYLLNNFPHRPHFYQPESVGAQAGYCLSPVPPSLRQFTNSAPKPLNLHSSSSSGGNRIQQSTTTHAGRSSHSLVSSAALSSLPSLSTTIASSSSSSSTSPLSSTSRSKPPTNTLKPQSSPPQEPSSSAHHRSPASMIITKKVLPVPPSLSPRVRQIFMDKINSQQAQSCAQLPRRKKKKAVDPVVPSI
ncbi:uncharacterized protein PGTG_03358 [Puccinia graminis f. sp. tritici CRL 75-36-700-3]|uniref:Uncharacterized protein n=1 Tax=Puccinia graminis f. sp. tritici (strain CRL 75-36-700-3 / race SCCL) TaxID=418459 RepID=E3JZC7_PUCGT|nr:uncharacterized protein PGTG_03358 [Puccinia graminis f. sp. tritici CRL 75-36-700-3]EFP77402.1 hypothetical protein PGTG_03358 [Puccinia graminis f. sp. tritici CRL 75-36-700-3]